MLHFEDVFGPCGDASLVFGPSVTTIQGVTFSNPDVFSYNAGKDYAGNPFDSDSYHLWTYAAGAVITFPQPISTLQFVTGVFTPQATYPTFELIANGQTVTTFGANLSALQSVNVSFPTAVTQVTIRFLGGSSSLLGLDDLSYTPVFERDCFGDGTGAACPCGNSGAPGNGCANSGFASGARLDAAGNASVGADSVVLSATNMTGSIAIFFQGATSTPPAVIDDGIGCVGGPIVRLGNKPAAGSSSYPQAGDPSVSVRGGVPAAGGTFYYQCFYRNAAAAFCPPATSNRTNGLQITWSP